MLLNTRDKSFLLNIQRIKLLPTAETRHNLFFSEFSTLLKTRDKIFLGVVEYKGYNISSKYSKDNVTPYRWKMLFSPFLFIRGLSCPSCIQASLSLNCLKLTIPGFPHNCLPVSCGDIGFKKNPGLEIRPQSAFSGFRALLSSANYSAEWSGWVWQPSADSNGLLAHHFIQQRAVTPDQESLNSNKKGAKLPLVSAEGWHTWLDGQHCPLKTYQGFFFKGGETLWWYK